MTDKGSALEAVTQFYAAEAAFMAADTPDFGPVAATLDEACLLHEPKSLPYGGEWRGHDGFERWMRLFKDTWVSMDVSGSEMFTQGDVVFSASHVFATARATGQKVDWALLQRFQIRGGKLLELKPFHWDTAALLKSLPAVV